MRKLCIAIGLATALVSGCASEYYAQIDGEVRGLDTEAPRTLRPGIYDDAALLRAVPSVAGPHLIAVKDGHVTIGLHFSDDRKPQQLETIVIEPSTSRFHWAMSGESHK